MKTAKKVKKLTIRRETLHSLDTMKDVFGGRPTYALRCEPTNVGTQCITDTDTYDTCGTCTTTVC